MSDLMGCLGRKVIILEHNQHHYHTAFLLFFIKYLVNIFMLNLSKIAKWLKDEIS